MSDISRSNMMTDDDFLLLPVKQARSYIGNHDQEEAARLRALYNSPEGRKRASASRQQSSMRQFGIVGSAVSFLAFGVSLSSAFGPEGNIVLPAFAASAFGIFAFMWMLGAIEQRLIEINQSIKRGAR